MSYNQNLKNGDPTIDIILFLTDKTKSPCFKFSIELENCVDASNLVPDSI